MDVSFTVKIDENWVDAYVNNMGIIVSVTSEDSNTVTFPLDINALHKLESLFRAVRYVAEERDENWSETA